MLAGELRQLTKRVTNRENKKIIAEALEYLETLKEPLEKLPAGVFLQQL